jgi:hypothetical protein
VVWGLKSGLTPWATPLALFCNEIFQDRVSWTICPDWFPAVILLISASWVANITGVSHLPLTSRQNSLSYKHMYVGRYIEKKGWIEEFL